MGEDELGRGTGRQGPWERDEDERAAKQEGDPHALDVDGDPRGGVQSDDYRHADPRDVVDEGVAMSGPAGAPQEDTSVEERREASRELREQAMAPQPPRED